VPGTDFQPQDYKVSEEDVAFLDNHLLILNKPAGLLVQPDKEGSHSLEDAAKEWLKQKFNKPGNVFATSCHRLDRPVSGLVVLARTSKALARMNALFQSREIRKIYLAVVGGKPESMAFLRHWIKKNETTNKVWTYTYPRGDARQADLCYWHLQSQPEKSLLLVRLFTGRHHQIRAQLSMAKLPIAGDTKYGTKSEADSSLCLCSYGMEFMHPVSGEMLRVFGRLPGQGSWAGFHLPAPQELEEAMRQTEQKSEGKS
jgi:23S rRNA pseudouridine1911/1915/1917 synthase